MTQAPVTLTRYECMRSQLAIAADGKEPGIIKVQPPMEVSLLSDNPGVYILKILHTEGVYARMVERALYLIHTDTDHLRFVYDENLKPRKAPPMATELPRTTPEPASLKVTVQQLHDFWSGKGDWQPVARILLGRAPTEAEVKDLREAVINGTNPLVQPATQLPENLQFLGYPGEIEELVAERGDDSVILPASWYAAFFSQPAADSDTVLAVQPDGEAGEADRFDLPATTITPPNGADHAYHSLSNRGRDF